ncbi:MAG TPA: serine hydrolase domain-containing protein, partial [Thermomicrobiales bacterium]|nr:serine hydrolase domain-containing protein [Thermomicrobiales bacterium]
MSTAIEADPDLDLEPLIAGILARNETPGASIATIADGVHRSMAVGSSDLDGHQPLGVDARFPIYSITKTFIATAILKLVEAGSFPLDLPARAFLPGVPLDPAITIRQLLNHTSGLPDYGRLASYHDDLRRDPTAAWSPQEFLERTLAQGPLFPPGQGWQYSNIGYLILNRVLDYAMWTSFADALTQLVITPAELSRTSVATSLESMRILTPGFSTALNDAADDRPRNIAPRYHPGWVSHGLVLSTATEVATFFDALFGGRLLTPSSLAAMLDPVRVPIDRHPFFVTPSYGLGLMLDPGSPHGLIAGHGGGGPGYSLGAVRIIPSEGGRAITSIALTNRDRGDVGLEIAWTIADAIA